MKEILVPKMVPTEQEEQIWHIYRTKRYGLVEYYIYRMDFEEYDEDSIYGGSYITYRYYNHYDYRGNDYSDFVEIRLKVDPDTKDVILDDNCFFDFESAKLFAALRGIELDNIDEYDDTTE